MSKLIEAFTATELPVGHLDAYKEGAAHGYLMAKRQMVEFLENFIEGAKMTDRGEFSHGQWRALEEARNYVRNVMLFKKE